MFTDLVATVVDQDVIRCVPLGGGDVAEAYRCDLADGRSVFAKTHPDPPLGAFTTEAAGLRWLRDSHQMPIPSVLAVQDGDDTTPALLVLEWIGPSGRPDHRSDAEFGRALARMHASGATTFGRTDRRPTGSRSLPNDPCTTWAEFYAARRLEPLRRLADEVLPERSLADLDRIIDRLDRTGVPVEAPARLHGDLWAGNRIVDAHGRSWLIDPAAHGGHREFDLAMMHLFGGFGPECFAAYDDEFALADGWRERTPLHQLAPLIVHAVKFGGGYVPATQRALDAALRLT